MRPTTSHILRLCAAWAALAAPAAAARLEVRAVNPFSGAVYPEARVLVFSGSGEEVCRGKDGIATCDLPAGDYRVRARLSGFGAKDLLVRMAELPVYRELALRIEEAIDHGRIGAFTRKSEIRLFRISGHTPVARGGYSVRISAVHDSFDDTTFAPGPDGSLGSLRPGLYQVTISAGPVSRALLAIIQGTCRVLSVPWDEMPREVVCR